MVPLEFGGLDHHPGDSDSAMHAAAMGFFQEAFHIGGLIVGYLLAAWQYQRLGFC